MRFLVFLQTTIFIAILSGCSNGPDIFLKINFQDAQLPGAVTEISGLSSPEAWGRWTDANVAPTAKIIFKSPLPRHFTLLIKGQSLQGHDTAKVRIGTFEQDFVITQFGDTAEIYVDLVKPENVIEIIPSNTASPRELGLNDDPRKLGIGLIEISIANVKP